MAINRESGLTLIELVVALVVSSILVAALYRTFIAQQKTYTIQEQVVDTQQNLRAAMNRMVKEIRMAGFGNCGDYLKPPDQPGATRDINGFNEVITSGTNGMTILGALAQVVDDSGHPILITSSTPTTLTLNYATSAFDGSTAKYICIGGLESNTVLNSDSNKKQLTLAFPLRKPVIPNTPIYKVEAVTYGISGTTLTRNENTGRGDEPLADNIEGLQFKYYNGNGNETADPAAIRMIKVTVTARTDKSDPDYKDGEDGFRRRQIATNIKIRNMGLAP